MMKLKTKQKYAENGWSSSSPSAYYNKNDEDITCFD